MSTLTAYKLNCIPSTLSLIQIPAGHDFRVEGTIDMTNDGALQLPTGSTGERPGSPSAGYTRWNTTTKEVETWSGSQWINLGG